MKILLRREKAETLRASLETSRSLSASILLFSPEDSAFPAVSEVAALNFWGSSSILDVVNWLLEGLGSPGAPKGAGVPLMMGGVSFLSVTTTSVGECECELRIKR